MDKCAYVITHVRVTEDQYQRYKDNPVLNMSAACQLFADEESR